MILTAENAGTALLGAALFLAGALMMLALIYYVLDDICEAWLDRRHKRERARLSKAMARWMDEALQRERSRRQFVIKVNEPPTSEKPPEPPPTPKPVERRW